MGHFKFFFFVFFFFLFFNFKLGGHPVQWSETDLAILIQGHERNISVKSF